MAHIGFVSTSVLESKDGVSDDSRIQVFLDQKTRSPEIACCCFFFSVHERPVAPCTAVVLTVVVEMLLLSVFATAAFPRMDLPWVSPPLGITSS